MDERFITHHLNHHHNHLLAEKERDRLAALATQKQRRQVFSGLRRVRIVSLNAITRWLTGQRRKPALKSESSSVLTS